MKNPNTKIIVAHILAFLVLCCVCSLVNAQSCKTMLDDARDFKSQGDYQRAIDMYNELLSKDCPDYINAAKKELTECKNKLYQNKPKPQQTSSGYIQQEIRPSPCISYFVYESNSVMEFDADGWCENPEVYVNCPCDSWLAEVSYENKEWLSVEQGQGLFVVRCASNQNRMERNGSINILVNTNGGTEISTINVMQGTKQSSPKPASRPNPTAQPNTAELIQENRSITVKVTFETGKATPRFENFGDLLVLLEKNKDIGLQIEVPWCNNQKSEVGLKKYPEALIKKRIKNITDHFGKSGIAKERISCSINYESNTECDCAYVKSVDLSGGSSR